jgi:hypothetical protein
MPALIRFGFTRDTGLLGRDLDRGAGDHGTSFISDRA